MIIENTQAGFEFLWRQIEATRQLLAGQSKRFCVRNILRSWFPRGALPRPRGEEMSFDDLVWNVCHIASPSGEIVGWTELPPRSWTRRRPGRLPWNTRTRTGRIRYSGRNHIPRAFHVRERDRHSRFRNACIGREAPSPAGRAAAFQDCGTRRSEAGIPSDKRWCGCRGRR